MFGDIKMMKEKLIDFIRHEFLSDDETELTEDTKLISSGLVDSFSLVSLQSFIAKEFGKKIPAPKITAESFDTIRQMLMIIEQF
jgi:acyl carrier protein